MLTLDDYERHNFNLITANSCNYVLTACPISAYKYKEVGKDASFMPIESDGKLYKDLKIKKDIDVFFFGKVNKDRKIFLDYLTNNGINLKVVGNNSENRVLDTELVKLICRSKIVVNLSKTTWGKIMNIPEKNVFSFQYQFKGRIIQAGLCGTACISEYAPHNELLYNSNELLQFKNKKECLLLIQDLLNNSKKLEEYSKIFSTKTKNFYEDEKEFKKIFDYLEKLEKKKLIVEDNLQKIPYWYNRICAKQILLRDLRITRFFSSIINFKELLYIAKKSNMLALMVIFIESFLNFIYYSLLNTIRTKSTGKNRYIDKF